MNKNPSALQSSFDVPEVFAANSSVQITGDVSKPGHYPLRGGVSLLMYLQDAGVDSTYNAPQSIMIVRTFGNERRSLVYAFNEPETLPRPKAGDVIIVNKSKAPSRQFIPTVIQGRKATGLTDVPTQATVPNPLAMQPTPALLSYIKRPAIKRLLNLLAERQAATGAKSFSIVSPNIGDGKTFFCASIALSYALLLDSRVLIIDCSTGKGSDVLELATRLAASESKVRTLQRGAIAVQRSADLRRSANDDIDFVLRNFIETQAADYDLVLIDTVATNLKTEAQTTDPIIAASQADASIIVLKEQSHELSILEGLRATLKQHSISVIGIVTNALTVE